MPKAIDYEELVEDFEATLNTKLRGHGVETQYLEMWVPDEDAVKSILNMVEAAEAAGQERIHIAVKTSTLPPHRLESLRSLVARIGNVDIEPNGATNLIHVTNIGGHRSFEGVSAAFRRGIAAAAQGLRREGTLAAADGREIYEAADGSIRLMVAIADEVIVEAAHSGAQAPADRAVLDVCCGVIEGITPQEAADHAAIFTMHALKDLAMAAPVAGILTPGNADPIFRLPVRLTRAINAAYREKHGASEDWNFFDRPFTPAWLSLSKDEKTARLRAISEAFVAERGLSDEDLWVVELDEHDRLNVGFGPNLEPRVKPGLLMDLERRIRRETGERVEVFLVEMKDLNKIRRI